MSWRAAMSHFSFEDFLLHLSSNSAIYTQWIGAVTGIFALVVSVWAVRLVNKTLKETQKATTSAQLTVELTKDLNTAQTRAYLNFSEPRVIVTVDGEEGAVTGLLIHMEVQNSGATPATVRILYIFSDIRGAEDGKPEAEFENYPRDELVVAPGTPKQTVDVFISASDLEKASRDSSNIYILGYMSFEDIFSQAHIQTICWRIVFRERFEFIAERRSLQDGSIYFRSVGDYHIAPKGLV